MNAPSHGPSSPPALRLLPSLVLVVVLLGAANPARAEFRAAISPVSACAGTYTDSGGPSANYANGEFFEQTLWPAQPNTRIALSFTSFSTETTIDFLTIYNGHDYNAPTPWGALSGTIPPFTIESTAADGSLTVNWVSDGLGTAAGWVAEISCVPSEQRMRDRVESTCDGAFTDSAGPDAPYDSFETYVATFYPTHTSDRLEVSFVDFDTEGGSDLLSVYDGTSISAPLLGTFSGTSLPPTLRATNSLGALTFRFLSDGTIVGNGWRAYFNCAHRMGGLTDPPVTTCSGSAVDSGGGGGFYSINESFSQTFLPEDPGAKIELLFDIFSTEATFDQLSIYDGSSTGAPLLGTWSGTSSPGRVTSSAGNGALTLTWSSDFFAVAQGWIANISCVYPIASGAVATCFALSTDTGGRAGNYGNSESFAQTFQRTRPWSRMRADVFSFSSENSLDVLTLRDGAGAAPVLATLTGSPTVPATWVAPNVLGQLTLDWHSDFSLVFPGWNAMITCELPVFADGFEGRDVAQWSLATP